MSESPLYKDFSETVEDLSSCAAVTVMNEIDVDLAAKGITDHVGTQARVYLFVPEEVRRAFDADVSKLDRKRDKLAIELRKIRTIVSTDDYKMKASQHAKDSDLKKVATA